MEKKQRTLNNKGFSLIELIVVIAIMAILVGVLAPQFIKYIESSRQSTDIQSASAIRSAIEAGVADGTITADVKVEVTATGIKVDDAGKAAVESVGIAQTTPCKSDGWKAGEIATYDYDKFSWKVPDAGSPNDNEPNKDICTAFK